jgi:hypothetical protein
MGEDRGVYRELVRKPEEKRSLEKPICRWEDNNIFRKLEGIILTDLP